MVLPPAATAWKSAPISTSVELLYFGPAGEDLDYWRPPKIFIDAYEALKMWVSLQRQLPSAEVRVAVLSNNLC